MLRSEVDTFALEHISNTNERYGIQPCQFRSSDGIALIIPVVEGNSYIVVVYADLQLTWMIGFRMEILVVVLNLW
jgi:hypothetical protein